MYATYVSIVNFFAGRQLTIGFPGCLRKVLLVFSFVCLRNKYGRG